MDTFTRFKLEYEGIRDTILSYTSNGYISNILKKLDASMLIENKEEIIYLLNIVNEWYIENQNRIQTNQFVFEKKQHIANQKKLVDYYKEIQNDISINGTDNLRESSGESIGMKKIFISHSSIDEKICTGFVELLEQLGVPEEDILYSSSDRHGVPGDENIFKYLRDHIVEGVTVFYMLSDNYYNSPYCLNEMGAAWIVQNDFSTFILPNLTVGIKGVIDREKKAYKLNSAYDLISIKEKINHLYSNSTSETRWEKIKTDFLNVVNG